MGLNWPLGSLFTISKGETKAAVYYCVILALAIFTVVPKLCLYIAFVPQSLQLLSSIVVLVCLGDFLRVVLQ